MNALKPRAPFQVLVMSEESRLGREAIETAYALKQLVQAGVRVFFYLENRERTLDSPTDKIMMSLTAFADELEREKARQRTYDAMSRKAKAGHVTGGRVFGYDNVDVMASDGQRSHVERRINDREAAVIRQIFALSVRGRGLTTIAKTLNAEGAAAPRSQQGRPTAWAPSSVREVLHRTLYRGEISWNRSRKRNAWGQVASQARPQAEWLSVAAPHLRIVPEEVWLAVQDRLQDVRSTYLRGTRGQLWGRPSSGVESKYLLPGLARCATCNGGLYVKSRGHGNKRAYFYGCRSFHCSGSSVCANSLEVPLERSETAVLAAIERDVLRPDVVATALRKALLRLQAIAATSDPGSRRAAIEKRQAVVHRDLDRLTAAIIAGGELETLIGAVKARETERAVLDQELRALGRAAAIAHLDLGKVERALSAKLDDWKGLLRRQVPQARQVLKKLLAGPILFTEKRDGRKRFYEFTLKIALGRVVTGLACATMVASPMPASWNQIAVWLRQIDTLRQAA